jgi:hypothetical protein
MPFGSLMTLDAIASTQQTIAELGEDRIWASLDKILAIHNEIQASLINDFVEPTKDRLKRYGGSAGMTMDRIDELGTPDAQKIAAGVNVGFPLDKYGRSLQWTRNYFQVATGEEFGKQVQGILDADSLNVIRAIKTALFRSTNYTVLDRWVDYVSLDVKALVNADGATIPPGPNGEEFVGGTHTHYLNALTLTTTIMDALILAITEHYNSGEIRIYINAAQESAVRALTGFYRYEDPRLVLSINNTRVETPTLDLMDIGNRAIGVYGSATVYVKPWVPANYLVAHNPRQRKPLALRTRGTQGNLQIEYDDDSHPLRAKGYFREFGLGVQERTNGAIAYIGAGGVYVIPVIT